MNDKRLVHIYQVVDHMEHLPGDLRLLVAICDESLPRANETTVRLCFYCMACQMHADSFDIQSARIHAATPPQHTRPPVALVTAVAFRAKVLSGRRCELLLSYRKILDALLCSWRATE